MSFVAKYPASGGGGSSSNASVGTTGITAPTSATEVGYVDNGGLLQPVSPSTPLPTTQSTVTPGAATSANQTTEITALQAIQSNTNGVATVAAQNTGNASLSTIASQTNVSSNGASTSALQTSGNSSLTTIATNSGTQATAANQTTGNASLSTIASQTNVSTNGASTSALQTAGNNSLATIATNIPPVGQALSAASVPVVLASDYQPNSAKDVQAAGTITALNVGVSINTSGMSSLTFMLGSTTYVGTLQPQVLGADGVTWFPWQCYASYNVAVTTAITNTTNTSYSVPVGGFRGFRLYSTAWTSGTATISINACQTPGVVEVVQSYFGALNVALGASSSNVGNVGLQVPLLLADVANGAITTTTTSSSIVPGAGTSYMINIPVTAVSGTTPTLTVQVQESADTGTNWYNVYTFPVITATGSYNSPLITLTGNRIRYVQTVTGTTPSFTRTINRLQSSQANTTNPGTGIFTARSGTVTTAGTSQVLAPVNQTRRYFFIQNLSSSATLYINFTSVATTGADSIAILPYGSFVIENNSITTEAINITSSLSGSAYTGKEM